MPLPAWEIEGGSSAVLLPVQQLASRWKCKILNYPKLYLHLTEDELNMTWQTVPRIDPKWLNQGSHWVDLDFLIPKGQLHSRTWKEVIERSWSFDRVVEQDSARDSRQRSEVWLWKERERWSRVFSYESFTKSYVRLWDTPFPTEPTAFVYNPKPKVHRATRPKFESKTALDLLLEDDE